VLLTVGVVGWVREWAYGDRRGGGALVV
jgi:hypothetical protein